MALDGSFLRHLGKEIKAAALDARVDKIYQPNREELVLSLRTRTALFKLLLSARANSARIHFTQFVPENPKQPPMLCMLLRKRLTGARLVDIRQPGLERLLYLDFDAANELGDRVRLTLVVEIMGRYSNIILIDEQERIVDSLKRVDAEMSSERLVLPGLRYQLPPPQDKLCMLTSDAKEILNKMKQTPADKELSQAFLKTVQGVSPVVCRELEHITGRGAPLTVHTMTDKMWERFSFFLSRLLETVCQADGTPTMASALDGKPIDFSFMNIQQYGVSAVVTKQESFSALLDAFYSERDRLERMRAKSQDLLRVLTNSSERLSRKINHQRAELAQCAHRDELRIFGDLIHANLYQIKKGASSVQFQNFYEESLPLITIKLDPALTPIQNAQKYYKEYRKAHTAEEKLTEQIDHATKELVYLDSVFEELSRAELERDLTEIRQELMEQGYLKMQKSKQKPPAMAAPLRFVSDDGFTILVGRNNRQNDKLTLHQANNNDIWFHTKNIPGSHVILVTQGREPTETAMKQAAVLAACHSKGKDSSQVPVDYTQVRHVSKPAGAKPGMVIYVTYNTVYVTPDMDLVESLKEKI